jgi:Ca2+-binding RTX toxin-like protein
MHISPQATRLPKFITTTAALALAAFVVPAPASANPGIDGVHAAIHHGTLSVRGSHRADTVALRLAAGDPNTVQVDVGGNGSADFSFARGDITAIDLNTGDGSDAVRVDDSNGAFTTTIPTTIAGGDGADSLTGGAGAETFRGGDGNDAVDGGRGADTAYLGAGDDSFRWDPGDGSDVIEGQAGTDTMLFDGAAISDAVSISANGGRVTFFRNPANVTMDTKGVETFDFNALGGPDSVRVGDLTGTDVTQINVELAGTLGGGSADGIADNVVVNATDGVDTIDVTGGASGVDVTGLHTAVSIAHPDPSDSLAVNTLAGTDNVFTSGIAGVIQVLVDGVAI